MPKMELATWKRRFAAWLIDMLILTVVLFRIPGFQRAFFGIGISTAAAFIYWTILEGRSGQSIGKIALGIKVVETSGRNITYTEAAVESFGKAFLLPIDVLMGWLGYPQTKQRLFSKVSETLVVRLAEAKQATSS